MQGRNANHANEGVQVYANAIYLSLRMCVYDSEVMRRSQRGLIIGPDGGIAGSTNASNCRACPAGSYSNASGGALYHGLKNLFVYTYIGK